MYLLLIVCYYFYICLIVWPHRDSLQGKLELLVFHLVFAMQQWSLIVVIFAEPGAVPLHWGFHVGDMESKRRRYCLMCHVFKPERCHHCSACNRCVLNMDHHCPWINNCVGFYNRKAFLLTLLYSSLLAIVLAVGSLSTAYYSVINLQYQTAWPGLAFIGLCLCSLFFAMILTAFLRFHLRLVLKNITTIENLEKSEARSNYSVGAWQNWYQVFGANPWMWVVPFYGLTGKPQGDGVHWMHSEPEYLDSSPKGNSEKAETPRIIPSSVMNSSISSKAPGLNIGVTPQRGRFFKAQGSEVDTDTSFLQNRSRLLVDAMEEVKTTQDTLNHQGVRV